MEVSLGFKETEAGVIPDEWAASTVGREFEIQLGKMLDSANNRGLPKPYLGNRAVQWDRIDTSELQTVALTPADLKRFRLHKGDLLVCEGGEVGRAAIWQGQLDECYYQKALHRLRARRGFNASLMLAYLRYWTENDSLGNYVSQTSIKHLTREKFAGVPLPVPKPAEQRAMAAAISDADALISSLDRCISKKRGLKQAAMQQLLTGTVRLPGFSAQWKLRSYGELFRFLKTASNPRADLAAVGPIGYVHYGDIHTSSSAFLNCAHVRLPRIPQRQVAGIPLLADGDLVMADASEDYAGIGKSVEIREANSRKIVAGLHTLLLRGNRDMLADGFKGYLQFMPSVRLALGRLATGISVYGASKNSVRTIEVMLPRVDEQIAIANVLSDMDAEIGGLERTRDKTRAVKQGMMQALLTGRKRLT